MLRKEVFYFTAMASTSTKPPMGTFEKGGAALHLPGLLTYRRARTSSTTGMSIMSLP